MDEEEEKKQLKIEKMGRGKEEVVFSTQNTEDRKKRRIEGIKRNERKIR